MSETFACETVEFQAGPRLDFVGEMPVPRAPRSCGLSAATPLRKPYRSRHPDLDALADLCLYQRISAALVAEELE